MAAKNNLAEKLVSLSFPNTLISIKWAFRSFIQQDTSVPIINLCETSYYHQLCLKLQILIRSMNDIFHWLVVFFSINSLSLWPTSIMFSSHHGLHLTGLLAWDWIIPDSSIVCSTILYTLCPIYVQLIFMWGDAEHKGYIHKACLSIEKWTVIYWTQLFTLWTLWLIRWYCDWKTCDSAVVFW